MRIHYTGRQVEITPGIKEQVAEKLDKIHRIMGRHLDLEAHVILSLERHLHSSEITLNLKDHPLVGLASGTDFYSSLQEATERLETQVLRHRRRRRVMQRHSRSLRKLTTRVAGWTAGEPPLPRKRPRTPAAGKTPTRRRAGL